MVAKCIDSHFNQEDAPITLQGWRLVNDRYQKMCPDAQERLLSRQTAVCFALSTDKQRLLLYDAVTGEEIFTEEQEEAARRAAEQRAQQAEAQAAALAEEVAQLKARWAQQNPGDGTG